MSSSENAEDQPGGVRKRRVFYLPGYDPFHPRRYRELYRKESSAQAAISGYEIGIKPRKGEGPYGWLIDSTQDGLRVETEMQVLVWHDIVKGSMDQSVLGTYLQLVRTAWAYIGSGALFRLMRLRKGPMIAALYPILFLLGQLVFAVWLADTAYEVGVGLFGEYMIVRLVFGAVFLAVLWGVLVLFRRYDSKIFAYYLMHDYAFSAQFGGANPPLLEARMREFGDTIAATLSEDVDEVLVVGHSSGAHLAVSILADLLREKRVLEHGADLSFLSLGQVVPMVSFLPKAARLRDDLSLMGRQSQIPWIDVTAPGDGCAFALCDPVAVSGMASADTRWPLVISAAFTQTLSPEQWRAMRWRFFSAAFSIPLRV